MKPCRGELFWGQGMGRMELNKPKCGRDVGISQGKGALLLGTLQTRLYKPFGKFLVGHNPAKGSGSLGEGLVLEQ